MKKKSPTVKTYAEAAERTLHAQDVVTLSERDRTIFVAALVKPAAPGNALWQAMQRYKERTGILLPGKTEGDALPP